MDEVKGSLFRGEDVVLIGFGNFVVTNRAARTMRNIQTKEMIDIPACKAVRFKVGKELKKALPI